MNTQPNYNGRKRIAVLGSTGSIGTQTLDVIGQYPHLFEATLLVAGSNVDLLIEQARAVRPAMAIIADESKYATLRDSLQPLGIVTAAGADAVADAMEADIFDTVVTATVGYSGLVPTLRAIKAGKDIALANKETMVVAGELVNKAAAESNIRIIPVDSEHSAIYQCLQGEDPDSVKRLIITASGGPFRQFDTARLATVTKADALKHPNWNMGAKITIDSATMMNKAFEIIEARWLFGMEPTKISAVVHPQSIIHSMVEFVDGAVKAQLGVPDMRLPIRYALGEARRLPTTDSPLSLQAMANLTFEEVDTDRFPCFNLAYKALSEGGTTACIINAANEVAVAAFLRDRIRFNQIYHTIADTLERVPSTPAPTLDDYVATNAHARRVAEGIVADFESHNRK